MKATVSTLKWKVAPADGSISSRSDDKDESEWSLPSSYHLLLGRWIGARPFHEKYTIIMTIIMIHS